MQLRAYSVIALSAWFALTAAPAAALTAAEVKAVLKCQDTIRKEGESLSRTVADALAACAAVKLDAHVKFENGVVDAAKFATLGAAADRKCRKRGARITAASTKFVDEVLASCEPVEDVVLGPDDPLAFVELFGATTAEELAGGVCVDSVLFALLGTFVQIPRGLTIAGATVPVPEFDPRCPVHIDID
jgi:hypothetical protein